MKKAVTLLCALALWSGSFHAQEQEARVAFDNYHKYYNQAPAVASPEKEKALEHYRTYFSKHGYGTIGNWDKTFRADMEKLLPDGRFQDLDDASVGKVVNGNGADNGGAVTEAYTRLYRISEAFRHGRLNYQEDGEMWRRCQKAIVHYGNLEIRRPNNSSRFHSSCFAIPTLAMNIYFCHLAQMEAAESGTSADELLQSACELLKVLGLQAWTQPFRNNETDNNVVQTARFRNHVWWVGGNALGYRSLLPVAFMLRSVPMVDVLAEVCRRGISTTSQETYHTSFWTEGFTADGAGWGHGKQCLVWGYPIDGTIGALRILSLLKDSPWDEKLTRQNVDALMNYFRGSNFYYYKGFSLPCLSRYSMRYEGKPKAVPYQRLLKQLLGEWSDSFTSEELAELKQLYAESGANDIRMAGEPAYNGSRYFYNNDDLVKKTAGYHLMVNMASVRCDGLESAHTFADAYNYYVTDGGTLFQKTGNEYNKALGVYDVTAYPGVTAREGMERLRRITNWRGYCSRHNFAGAATFGGDNAVAGYLFEKMNASDKEGVNDKGSGNGKDEVLYGVKAYKSYFIMGDYLIALGAGVTNLTPHVEGTIRTTIEQTEHTGDVSLYKGKGIEWIVQQGKFAYSVFPEHKKKMHYVCETKATDWMRMNPSNKGKKDLPEKVDLLRVWIDHGQTPVNDTYGYAVYCGEGKPARRYPFGVLRNDTLVQAVKSADGRVVEAVFYDERAALNAKGVKLKVSAPCVVLVEQTEQGTRLAVTDARMDKGCNVLDISWNGKTYQVEMPQGEQRGKPAVTTLDE